MFNYFAEKKMARLGFVNIEEKENNVVYSRSDGRFTQIVEIHKRNNGKTYVLSYDKDLFDSKKIGNTCVALHPDEMRAILRKIRAKKWRRTDRLHD